MLNHNFKTPIIALAPMADYTNQPFSLLCREISGNNFLIFREMVSAEAVVRNNEKTLKMCEFLEIERPIILQIFGHQPKVISQAIKILNEKYSPDGFDVNMGCPVPKIADRSQSGVALMKNLKLAEQIIYTILEENPKINLSIKTRLGWSKNSEILTFAPALEKLGIKLISVHGRTKSQGYSGKANWEMIGKIKKLLKIPLLANGDIKNNQDIKKCLKIAKADGVMIGRGVLGNPWLLSEKEKPDISSEEFRNTIMRHAELQVKIFGEKGLIILRKHLPWYFTNFSNNDKLVNLKKIRSELVKISTLKDINAALSLI